MARGRLREELQASGHKAAFQVRPSPAREVKVLLLPQPRDLLRSARPLRMLCCARLPAVPREGGFRYRCVTATCLIATQESSGTSRCPARKRGRLCFLLSAPCWKRLCLGRYLLSGSWCIPNDNWGVLLACHFKYLVTLLEKEKFSLAASARYPDSCSPSPGSPSAPFLRRDGILYETERSPRAQATGD